MNNEVIVKKKRKVCCPSVVKRWEKFFAIVMRISSCLCCFNQQKLIQLNRQKQTLGLTLFWRVHDWKQSVLEFDPNPERMAFFDKAAIQNSILAMFALHRTATNVFFVLPFFMDEGIAFLMAYFLGYLLCFEVLIVILSRMVTKLNVINPYLWLQIFSGFLKKSTVLSLAFVGGQSARIGELPGQIFGGICLFIVALDQYKSLRQIWEARLQDKSSLMPLVERTQKVTALLGYQGFLVVLKRITLLPSKTSMQNSQKIQQELNPDLI